MQAWARWRERPHRLTAQGPDTTDPDAPGNDDDRLTDDGGALPPATEEHEPGSGAARKTNVKCPPGDRTQALRPDDGSKA